MSGSGFGRTIVNLKIVCNESPPMGIVYNGGLQKLRIADWQALFLENVIAL
jgi:hypothetical protein